jgi:hypothetical protein
LCRPKSIFNTTLYFIFTCREFSTCGEPFFQLHSNTLSILSLFFIKIIFLLFYFNFFSLSSFLASFLNPPRSAQTTTPGCHRSVTHATNISRSTTHNPKPPPTSHPCHKHLKISNPTTTHSAQSHPRLHHHAEIGANHHTQAEISEQTQTQAHAEQTHTQIGA